MLPRKTSLWQHDSQPTASGKPGAVHYAFRLTIDAVGARPPFGEVVDHVYGTGANIDTDGDSRAPSATDWTWLYMCQRPTRDAPVVEVMLSDERGNLMFVASDDEALAQRTAAFLALRTGGRVTFDPAA